MARPEDRGREQHNGIGAAGVFAGSHFCDSAFTAKLAISVPCQGRPDISPSCEARVDQNDDLGGPRFRIERTKNCLSISVFPPPFPSDGSPPKVANQNRTIKLLQIILK